MKKILSMMCVFAILFSCMAQSVLLVSAETVTEYITNGSFDNNTLDGWILRWGNKWLADGVLKLSTYHGGLWQHGIELNAGKKYTLSFKAKSEVSDYNTIAKVVKVTTNDQGKKVAGEAILDESISLKTSGFITYTYTFLVGTTGEYGVWFGTDGEDEYIKYLDNVSLTDYIEPEYITNGSFNDGNNGWTVPYNAGRWGVITDPSSGNSMMKIEAYQSNLRQLDIELSAGTYELCFRAKSDNADYTTDILVDGTAIVLSTTFDIKSSGFQTFSFPFTVETAGNYNVKIGNNGLDPQNKYIDDVSLKSLSNFAFTTHSLVLSGEIGVNFFMDLSGLTLEEKAGSYMSFEVTNGTRDIDHAPYDSTAVNDSEYNCFTCYVSSVQMAEEITPTFHYGSGKTITGTPYSINDYTAYIIDNSSSFSATHVNYATQLNDYFSSKDLIVDGTIDILDLVKAEYNSENDSATYDSVYLLNLSKAILGIDKYLGDDIAEPIYLPEI